MKKDKPKIEGEPEEVVLPDAALRRGAGCMKIQKVMSQILAGKVKLGFDDQGFFTQGIIDKSKFYSRIVSEIYDIAIMINPKENNKPISTAIEKWFLKAKEEDRLIKLFPDYILELIFSKNIVNAFKVFSEIEDRYHGFFSDELINDFGNGSYTNFLAEIYSFSKDIERDEKGRPPMAQIIKKWCLIKKAEGQLPDYILRDYFVKIESKEKNGELEEVFYLKQDHDAVELGQRSNKYILMEKLLDENKELIKKGASAVSCEKVNSFLELPKKATAYFLKKTYSEWYEEHTKKNEQVELNDELYDEAILMRDENHLSWKEISKELNVELNGLKERVVEDKGIKYYNRKVWRDTDKKKSE